MNNLNLKGCFYIYFLITIKKPLNQIINLFPCLKVRCAGNWRTFLALGQMAAVRTVVSLEYNAARGGWPSLDRIAGLHGRPQNTY